MKEINLRVKFEVGDKAFYCAKNYFKKGLWDKVEVKIEAMKIAISEKNNIFIYYFIQGIGFNGSPFMAIVLEDELFTEKDSDEKLKEVNKKRW